MFKRKWIASVLAWVFLVGAIGCYNFIDKSGQTAIAVGQECPNFIGKPYEINGTEFTASNDVYTLVKQRGKVCVLNFWETWCAACIQELPEFNRLQEEYIDKIEVVAALGTTSTIEVGAAWLSEGGWRTLDPNHNWAGFSLTFVCLTPQDGEMLGVSGMLPRTVIVDENGIVVFEINGSMTYERLKEEVDKALN